MKVKAHVTPEAKGFIVGLDWLAIQKEVEWDFMGSRIRFAGTHWIDLHEDEELKAARHVWTDSSEESLSPTTARSVTLPSSSSSEGTSTFSDSSSDILAQSVELRSGELTTDNFSPQ